MGGEASGEWRGEQPAGAERGVEGTDAIGVPSEAVRDDEHVHDLLDPEGEEHGGVEQQQRHQAGHLPVGGDAVA